MEVRKLEWDSGFFGRAMGELFLAPGQEPDKKLVAEQNYAYLMTRVEASNRKVIQKLEQLGFVTEDWSYILEKKVADKAPVAGVRPARLEDIPAVKAYGKRLFTHSRFYKSPYFTRKEADQLHEKWIENLWLGLADAVLVYDVSGFPAGFISTKDDTIQLVGVSPDFQKRGVGRTLVQAALNWFFDRGIALAKVKTQVDNLPAVTLYINLGFLPVKCEVTLSLGKEIRP